MSSASEVGLVLGVAAGLTKQADAPVLDNVYAALLSSDARGVGAAAGALASVPAVAAWRLAGRRRGRKPAWRDYVAGAAAGGIAGAVRPDWVAAAASKTQVGRDALADRAYLQDLVRLPEHERQDNERLLSAFDLAASERRPQGEIDALIREGVRRQDDWSGAVDSVVAQRGMPWDGWRTLGRGERTDIPRLQ